MIEVKFSSLKGTKVHEYLIRFALGGIATAIAGLIAERFGPVVGGLFLAFPAIFPAAATMVEKHERERKKQAGMPAGKRGRMVAGVEAGGAALGTIGLAAFALVLWKLLPHVATWVALTAASLSWFTVSVSLWWLRRRI